MAGLFLLLLLAFILAAFGWGRSAVVLTLINLILALAMLWYHATNVLQISL